MTSVALINLQQANNESLHDFVAQFLQIAVKIQDLEPRVALHAMIATMKLGAFANSLYTSYNILLGIPTLNKLGAIVSTPHLAMKFLSSTREIVIMKANQVDACECYVKSCKIEMYNMVKEIDKGKAPIFSINTVVTTLEDLNPRSNYEDWRPTPTKDIELFQIDKESNQCTQIDKKMEDIVQKKVEQVLLSNIDLFTWSISDMPSINPRFICHKLAIFSDAKLVA